MSDEDNVAVDLHGHPYFAWREGMRDQRGRRIVDLDLWDDGGQPPDLTDAATAGVLLQAIVETGRLTDVVRQGGEWIVAVDLDEEGQAEGVQGYVSPTLGEAVAHALLAAWELPTRAEV